ncbi:uncharacterized protein MONOS_15798 [Monocercomonoides exilis]|uniref:uncharacterized protein n=1 Tax=Monocercomonoides exilis TaxID=2049356 RepID=UPI003559446D|nr:hypothetical protein MONOS_15798 [Monocercomonoides exilis]|eukprot:MONOS_15798.1-p1 / transcript=MONOS_15798.1 / gene=MONOS_15798 / organism=Monocercomonoides_exilis_PA203 / gene_product=unspecified product / transcript_product=unspecified product / location=Mono_scaffold01359:7409-7984(-) / protein_length=192 / sequence_SO=supercontig / SO=protein_coding / is_pseudo=false
MIPPPSQCAKQLLNKQCETKSSPFLRLNIQIAPPLEAPSSHESFVPVVFDPLHSHHVNEFAPLSVVFCLPGVNLTSAFPSHTTFLVRQHPTNEVFETVRKAKGLLREETIPPSYASQSDENEQLFIKHVVWEKKLANDEHAPFAVEMSKKVRWERDTKGMEGEEKKLANRGEMRFSLRKFFLYILLLPHAS